MGWQEIIDYVHLNSLKNESSDMENFRKKYEALNPKEREKYDQLLKEFNDSNDINKMVEIWNKLRDSKYDKAIVMNSAEISCEIESLTNWLQYMLNDNRRN